MSTTAILQRTACATSARGVRAFQSSALRKDLVGPPDPVSHLRPVIYDDAPPLPSSDVRHPYSLREFKGDTREYQWKIQRQELDAFNQAFWTDNNSRFHAAKETFLASLPESCTEDEKDAVLADFYKGWVAQEAGRQREYTAEWQKRNRTNIILGMRLQCQKALAWLGFSS